MFGKFLHDNINGGALGDFIPEGVEVGFAQVEPNHLSAQRTSQVYAQLPAKSDIKVLQQGQFVKYDYAEGEVNFTGPGEWMLVYNEIKLYREFQNDCEFAMIKDNYKARVYSPFGGAKDGSGPDVVDYNGQGGKQTRYYGGKYPEGERAGITIDGEKIGFGDKEFPLDRVTIPGDFYEMHYNDDPYHIAGDYREQKMKDGTAMVPRVFKTNVGDIFTTNAVDSPIETLKQSLGETLKVRKTGDKAGFLALDGDDDSGMVWQIVKVYTMPDHQFGVKVMRIA